MNLSSILAGTFVLGIFTSLSAVGCGGGDGDATCAKANECAKKAGVKYSETECRDGLVKLREQYETAGCGEEYSDYIGCVDGIDFDCADDFEKRVSAECGAEEKKLAKCAGDEVESDGKASDGPNLTSSESCADAAQRIYAKLDACGLGNGQTPDGSTSPDCTQQQATVAAAQAQCYQDAPCGALDGTDSSAVDALSRCVNEASR